MRELSDKLKNHYCRFCALNGFEARWVEVWETQPGPHSHLICSVPHGLTKAFRKSVHRSKLLGEIKAVRIYDKDGLVNYLSGEASSSARLAMEKPMRRGSYKLPGGGDRVRVSPKFKRELIAARLIEPWQETNARRASKAVDIEALSKDFAREKVGLFFVDELPETTELTKTKLRPRRRDKIAPPSLPLSYPPTVAELLAGLGLTHEAIGALVGLSRPQITNIIQGRFGMSRSKIQRTLELARAA